MQVKEGAFDRIEQSFSLLFKDFKTFLNIFISYFSYKFIVIIIFSNIFYYSFISFFNSQENLKKPEDIINIFGTDEFIILISFYIIFIFLSLIFIIPFIITTYKTIKDYFEEKENINIKENLKYSFGNLGNAFKTYWYIFAYIALIPLIVLIIGLILILLGINKNIDSLFHYGSMITTFGIVLLIVFSIYRGLQTKFSIVSAIDKNSYTKENFKKSIEITENNLLRILGNFLLIGIMISLLSGIFSSIITLLNSFGDNSSLDSYKNIFIEYTKNIGDLNGESLKKLEKELNNINSNTSLYNFNIYNIFIDIINLFFQTIIDIFVFVFTYLFYKRLVLEKNKETGNFDDTEIKTKEKKYMEL